MKLATNFSLDEFLVSKTAEERGIENAPNADEIERLRRVAGRLQELRDFLADALKGEVKIRITSGFRSAALNTAVGGVSSSSHRKGDAVDFWAEREDGRAVSPHVLMRTIELFGRFDQAIFYPGQVRIHVGYGPRERLMLLQKAADGSYPEYVRPS